MDKGGPDVVRDTSLFASIGNGATLSHLDILGEVFPNFQSISLFSYNIARRRFV